MPSCGDACVVELLACVGVLPRPPVPVLSPSSLHPCWLFSLRFSSHLRQTPGKIPGGGSRDSVANSAWSSSPTRGTHWIRGGGVVGSNAGRATSFSHRRAERVGPTLKVLFPTTRLFLPPLVEAGRSAGAEQARAAITLMRPPALVKGTCSAKCARRPSEVWKLAKQSLQRKWREGLCL